MKNKLNIKAMFRIAGNLNRARSAKVPLLIIALAVIIGFSFTACANDDESGDSSSSLTITGLGDYNGKYAIAIGVVGKEGIEADVIAAADINFSTQSGKGGKITNGSVTLKVWNYSAAGTIFTGSGEAYLTVNVGNTESGTISSFGDEPIGVVLTTFSNGKASGVSRTDLF